MKALVTGVTGFLGRRLVCQLLDEGWDVRCLARRPAGLEDLRTVGTGRLEVRQGDLRRLDHHSDVVEGCDIVYHLAAELRGGTSALFLTNVVATRGLVGAAAREHIRRFVLVSSLGVYGTAHLRPGAVLDERCPPDPEPHRRDPYSYSKIAQEAVAWEAHRRGELSLVVVRPAVIYGPGREVITARVGLRLGDFVLQMGGRHRLPYTFVDNCAEAIRLAGIAAGVEGEAFNVVDDELPTGRQILRLYRCSVGRVRALTVPRPAIRPLSGLCEWYHERSRGQLPAILTCYKSNAQWKPLRYSNGKAKTRLGWRPRVGLDEGLQRTLAWLRQQVERERDAAAADVRG
jgi:nucleoside-diphosphate-sugar epimerase